MADRDFDIVVFGATGFTGKLVAEWLAEHAPEGLSWAIAGRNPSKLERVRSELAGRWPALRDLALIQADSSNEDDVRRLAESTRVVCTTVGPYLAYGLPLAAACARAGTHYCDLTGETLFIRKTIDTLEDVARETGARIVHCCGYDSIPSDMGTLLLQDHMIAQGAPAQRVTTYVGPTKGGFSGGTIASMIGLMEAASDRSVRRQLADPYNLDPADGKRGVDTWDQGAPAYDETIGTWTAPFVMAAINTRVVRRSHALLGYPWGEGFSYTETMSLGPDLGGRLRAYAVSAGLGAFVAAVATPGPRKLLTKYALPAPGEGPDEEARETGFFRHLVTGIGADPSHRAIARVRGIKDPGYGETAKMLSNAALCLALNDDLPDRAGILTPASGIGLPLLDRLRDHGMTWSTEDWPASGNPRP
jgi:short subunit dehydrogenase-like uncharacterized protein